MASSIAFQKSNDMSQSQMRNQQKFDASLRMAQQTYYIWFKNSFEEEEKECSRENKEKR